MESRYETVVKEANDLKLEDFIESYFPPRYVCSFSDTGIKFMIFLLVLPWRRR
jgi:hypothetical protein